MINLNYYSSYSESVEACIDRLQALVSEENAEEASLLVKHIKEGMDTFLNN